MLFVPLYGGWLAAAAAAAVPWCGARLVCCVHRGLGEL